VKFGKLEDVSDVDFRLPDIPDATRRVLAAAPRTGPARCRLGLPRFGDRGLVGSLYPPRTPARRYLAAYADQLDAIELNATYYRIDPVGILRWAEATPTGFRFCPKLSKTISHARGLTGTREDVHRFLRAIENFGERLGPAWLLLPERFGPDRLDVLLHFLDEWPDAVSLAVELRHPGWFATRTGSRAFDEMEARGVSSIVTDVAGRRDVLHGRLTTATAIVRFVGTGEIAVDTTRIDAWADRLHEWWSSGLRDAYVFLHQPEERDNVPILHHLAARLTSIDVPVRRPAPIALAL
jgi:uncharacterized protein YecE (DUF72 family)